jgi:hypothetical protein
MIVAFAALAVASFLALAALDGLTPAKWVWGSLPAYSVLTIVPGLLLAPYAAAIDESRCDSLPRVRRYVWAAFGVFAAAQLPLLLLFPK